MDKYFFSHHRFQTYLSDCPGAGKSFAVRRSLLEWQKYAYLPTTNSFQLRRSLSFLSLSLSSPGGESVRNRDQVGEGEDRIWAPTMSHDQEWVLHIDIFDTSANELDACLFEFVFFGGLCDAISGCVSAFNTQNIFIRFEIATGPLRKRLIVPFFGEIHQIVASRDTFEINKRSLRLGMGKQRFYGRRYDGTSLRKEEGHIRPASAYERLHYVMCALSALDRSLGRFPLDFDPNVWEGEGNVTSLIQPIALTASECESLLMSEDVLTPSGSEDAFDLLVKYSHTDPNRVSLWCVWNFINMVYWQLREIQYPDCPIQKAFDENDRKARERSEFIKGNLVRFVLDTACEFATRQLRVPDTERVCVCIRFFCLSSVG